MSKLVFDEWYGTISVAQQRAYKKYNVSPSDHDGLTYEFGEEAHDKIVAIVKERSKDGTYREPFPSNGWF